MELDVISNLFADSEVWIIRVGSLLRLILFSLADDSVYIANYDAISRQKISKQSLNLYSNLSVISLRDWIVYQSTKKPKT